MTEDKVMKQIHQNQKRWRQANKGLTWDEETRKIARIANSVGKKYKMKTLPASKAMYAE